MKTTCPHCTQHLELDQETLDLLQDASYFECPSCGGRVPVVSPTRNRPVAAPVATGMPAAATTSARGSNDTNDDRLGMFRGLNRNLRILGGVALLVLGGLAVFLASRHTGNTITKRQIIHNQIIHNEYFTKLIASGATTAKDLEAVEGLLGHDSGFIGVSREKLTWDQARDQAKRTGAEILAFDTAAVPNKQVAGLLAVSYPDLLGMTVWVMADNRPRVIDSPDVLDVTTLDRPRRVFLHWRVRDPDSEAADDFPPAEESAPVVRNVADALPAAFGSHLELRNRLTGAGSGLRFDAQGNPMLMLQPAVEADLNWDTIMSPRGGIVKLGAADGKVLWMVAHAELECMGGYADSSQCRAGYQLDGGGDLLFVGESYTKRGRDVMLAKIEGSGGRVLWKKRFNRSADGDDLIVEPSRGWPVDEDGNITVSIQSGGPGVPGPGITVSPSSPKESFATTTIRFDGGSGRELWETRTMEVGQFLNELFMGRSGSGDILCGVNETPGNPPRLMALGKTSGRILWEISRSSPNPVIARADGTLCGAGFYDPSGKLRWELATAPNMPADGLENRWQDVIATPRGDYWLIWNTPPACRKFDGSSGRMICESGPLADRTAVPAADGGVPGRPVHGFADSDGNCLVTWFREDVPEVAKLSGSDGTILWRKMVDCQAEEIRGDSARIDHQGNLLLVFKERNKESRAIKFANAGGRILWDRELPMGHQGFEVDAAGNLWVIDRETKMLAKIAARSGNIELMVTLAK